MCTVSEFLSCSYTKLYKIYELISNEIQSFDSNSKQKFFLFKFLGRRLYLLTDTKRYTVGRGENCDFRIIDDSSVSRDHAAIYRSSSGVRVEDLKSKYNVFVNSGIETKKPIEPNTPVELLPGNIVRFGRLDSTFRLENIEIKVCTSTLPADGVEKLRKKLKLLDGTLQNEWSTECTHLVMPNVTVTIKVLQSLAYGIPIVVPHFWDAYIDCVRQSSQELPKVDQFIPEISEPYIIKESGMMAVHLDRARLFHGKTFVFIVKHHMERFEPIIKLAAGKCLAMDTDRVRKSFLLKTECIPIQYTPSVNSQCSADVESLVAYIESKNRRLVAESEIGLAILHRSIDRFCNPDRKMVADFEPETVNTDEIIKNVLIEETPLQSGNSEPGPSIFVPETVDMSDSEPNNNQNSDKDFEFAKPSPRKSARLSSKSDANNPIASPKKVTASTSAAAKRKFDDQNEKKSEKESKSAEQEQAVPSKKPKIAVATAAVSDENPGENSSGRFVEPAPSASQQQRAHDFSGFISTQSRRKRNESTASSQQATARTEQQPSELTKANRKRALKLLDSDSDDETDKNQDNLFNFNRMSKRAKTATNKKQGQSQRNILDDSDDGGDSDGDGNLFSFSNRRNSERQNQQSNEVELNEIDGPSNADSKDSYKIPFHQTMNRSRHRHVREIELQPSVKCDAAWITKSLKNDLNLSEAEPSTSNSVKIKDEKLEEWEITEEEKKRRWAKTIQNAFAVRKIEVNLSRSRSMIDETDSVLHDTANTTNNRTKNFKKFVKVNFLSRNVEI